MAARQTEDEDPDGGGDGSFDLVTREEAEAEYNFLESVKAAFSVDDDLLAAILANQVKMARLEKTENELLREIRDQQAPDLIGEFPFDMSHTVPADTTPPNENEVERVPDQEDETHMVAVSLGWPDGANNAVGIQISTGDGLKLLPRNPEDDFLGFNDFAETFGLRYTLRPGEKLIARTVNHDSTNDHFVNIVPHIEEIIPREDGEE